MSRKSRRKANKKVKESVVKESDHSNTGASMYSSQESIAQLIAPDNSATGSDCSQCNQCRLNEGIIASLRSEVSELSETVVIDYTSANADCCTRPNIQCNVSRISAIVASDVYRPS